MDLGRADCQLQPAVVADAIDGAGQMVSWIPAIDWAAVTGSSRAVPRTKTSRAPELAAESMVAPASSTGSIPAGQVRWWSATVVTPAQ